MLIALAAAALAAAQPAPLFVEKRCAAPELAGKARCGMVRVPEDRSRRGGRTIDLNLIVLPADAPRLPPLFDIDGGPGLAATKNAGFYLTNGVRRGRDVVLLDQRGTGASNGLHCPALANAPTSEPMLPVNGVKRCRAQLSAKADLTRYGTADAVRDLDDVRRALGYRTIDLFGLSYGTTVALRYMATYPGAVRAAVLMGTAPPAAMPPRHHATAGQRVLAMLLADCAADPKCNAAGPLEAELNSALARLPTSDRELFLEQVRTRLYMPASRAGVPRMIRDAASSGWKPGRASSSAAGSPVADGMFLSVTCGESFGLMDYAEAAAAAGSTPFGDYRLRRQRAACAHWPKAVVDPAHLAPIRTDAEILFVSGEWDPVTPPQWADALARTLPRARHVVIPRSGHVFDGMSSIDTCLDPLMIAFLDHGDPARVDPACVAEMRAPPYQP